MSKQPDIILLITTGSTSNIGIQQTGRIKLQTDYKRLYIAASVQVVVRKCYTTQLSRNYSCRLSNTKTAYMKARSKFRSIHSIYHGKRDDSYTSCTGLRAGRANVI